MGQNADVPNWHHGKKGVHLWGLLLLGQQKALGEELLVLYPLDWVTGLVVVAVGAVVAPAKYRIYVNSQSRVSTDNTKKNARP